MASHKATGEAGSDQGRDQGQGQLTLMFEAVQTSNADGSFTVRPKRIAIAEEIGVKRAARILRMHADTVRRLCELGETGGGIKAFKNPSVRGNAKWRIDWESCMSYKQRRQAAVARGED